MSAVKRSPAAPSLFPCIEEPVRVVFRSPSYNKSFLSVTAKGSIITVPTRSDADEFVIFPQNEKYDGNEKNIGRTVLLKSVRHGIFLAFSTKDGSIDRSMIGRESDLLLSSSEVTKEKIELTQWRLTFHRGGYVVLTTSEDNESNVKRTNTKDEEHDAQKSSNDGCGAAAVTETLESEPQFCLTREGSNSVCCRHVINGEERSQNAMWGVEFQTGELLFISSASKNSQRIRCDLVGNLSSSTNWKGWEVWRFIETADGDGSVLVSSFCHEKYFLCSDGKGKVHTNKDRTAVGCKWVIEKAPPTQSSSHDNDPELSTIGVMIKSVATGRTLKLSDDGVLYTVDESEDGTFGLWQLETAHQQAYYMRLASPAEQKGENWRIGINAHTSYLTKNPLKRASEEWKIEIQTSMTTSHESGFQGMVVTLCSEGKGTYLASSSDGAVYPSTGPVDDSLWRMDEVSGCGYTLTSVKHGRILSRMLRTVAVDGEKQSIVSNPNNIDELAYWQPEPRLPRRVDAPKMRSIALATTFAVATTVAVPFALGGAVAALGIAEAGVAAEIVAAGLTTAEAVASVAVVGATARALMHGTEIGAFENDGSDGKGKDDSCEEKCGHRKKRPLCHWREW